MKLSDILAALREIRVSPAKTLGQNFLHDQNLARWIVDQAQITPDDYVVEIGPGLGALTRFILEKGAHVLAIEKDARLAGFLHTHFPNQRLEILDSDALKFDPRSLFAHRTVKLLGNLPYNVSSVLLLRFLEHPSPISLLLLMLQKEVADRLSASPSTHDYGALTLPQLIALANCIAPPPDPDTAVNRNERFPIVDKKDRILRYANRSEVHGNNLRHRAVHILIFNEAGELYLQQRSRWKDRHPLKWDSSAAGHVAFRESYDETARRELKEELGTTVPLHKVSKVSASQRTDHEFIWLYRGLTSGDLVPDNFEIEQGAFFRPAVIDGWTSARPEDFAPGFLECWKAYRRKTRAA